MSEQPTMSPRGPRRSYRPAELIVAADAVDFVTRRLEQDDRRSVASSRPIDGLGLCQVTLDGRESRLPVPALVRMLRAADPNLVVGPNRLLAPASHIIIRPTGPPGHADAPREAGVLQVDGPRPRVGVIDTGYWDHPWFRGRVTGFRDNGEDLEADEHGRPTDLRYHDEQEFLVFGGGHGTFVAGCILKQAPQADVIVRRVDVDRPAEHDHHASSRQHVDDADHPAEHDHHASSRQHIDDVDLAKAIIEVGDSGVDILNLSLSTRVEDEVDLDEATELLATANAIIEIRQRRPNLVIVAPAGNDGPADGPVWPAAFDTVIAVGARDQNGEPAEFSNRGEWVTASAPEEPVTSTFLCWDGLIETKAPAADQGLQLATGKFHEWATWSGTSFAAASVSGAIAAEMLRLSDRLPLRVGVPQLLPAREAAAALLYANGKNKSATIGVPLLP